MAMVNIDAERIARLVKYLADASQSLSPYFLAMNIESEDPRKLCATINDVAQSIGFVAEELESILNEISMDAA